MAAKTRKAINIGDAEIAFRNFSGKEGQYNPAGHRNFCVILDPELARILERDGWNIRTLKPRDDQDDPRPYVQVAVRFDNIPPKITMITGRGKTELTEDEVHILDWADIEKVDLVLSPSAWKVGMREGVKCYLKSMWITIAEDPFEAQYYDTPDSADNAMCDGCQNVTGSCAECAKHDVGF